MHSTVENVNNSFKMCLSAALIYNTRLIKVYQLIWYKDGRASVELVKVCEDERHFRHTSSYDFWHTCSYKGWGASTKVCSCFLLFVEFFGTQMLIRMKCTHNCVPTNSQLLQWCFLKWLSTKILNAHYTTIITQSHLCVSVFELSLLWSLRQS